MSSYVIVEIHVTDPVAFEEYKKLAQGSIADFGGKYIARGGRMEMLEGELEYERIVLLEFPTLERAKEWWASKPYQRAKKFRETSAKTRMIVIESV